MTGTIKFNDGSEVEIETSRFKFGDSQDEMDRLN